MLKQSFLCQFLSWAQTNKTKSAHSESQWRHMSSCATWRRGQWAYLLAPQMPELRSAFQSALKSFEFVNIPRSSRVQNGAHLHKYSASSPARLTGLLLTHSDEPWRASMHLSFSTDSVCVNTKQSDAAIRLLLALLACKLSVTLLLDKPLLVHTEYCVYLHFWQSC